ncbi:hypothetical protein FACS1894214_0860 [Planctomycetales bacterium]|nr:hypothetical protein FACS1894214_0860 [Planctomycetales bacterium]
MEQGLIDDFRYSVVKKQMSPLLDLPSTLQANREELSEIVERLVKVYRPLRIYLFGSYAWGTPHQDSDYDICVVVGQSDEDRWQRSRRGEHALAAGRQHRSKSVDIVVHTLNSFELGAEHPSALEFLINRKGKLLYSLPESAINKLRSILPPRKPMVVKLYESWLFLAEQDLKTACALMQTIPPLLDTAIYHTQQCAEKALKAFLVCHQQELQKTHQLEELIGKCMKIDPGFIQLTDEAEFISPSISKFRYPDALNVINDVSELLPNKNDVQTSIDFAEHILDFVKQKIENKTTEHAE